MKTKEIILITVAVVAMLLFAAFMFTDYRKSQKNKLLREDLVNDSLIMLKQEKFLYNDSVIFNNLNKQDQRIYRLEYMHRYRDTVKK
jgi:hypothetical protein